MKPNRLLGGSSLFSTDPQAQLRRALKSNDFATFKNLVNHAAAVNLKHVYDYPDFKTCLELAVSEPNKKEFVELILHKINESEVNEINATYNAGPIHFAVENGNKDALAVLLSHKCIDVDIKSNGNTALLLAIKKIGYSHDDRKRDLGIYEDMVEQLLKAGCNVNIPDLKGTTPVALAAEKGLERIVTLILVNAKKPFATYKDLEEKTARDYLKEAFPHLLPNFNTEETETIDVDKLFSYISRHEEDKFIRGIAELKEKNEYGPALSAKNGMLQFATKNGLERVVETLLIFEADPNATCSGNTSRPIAIACQYGYPEILKMFIDNKSTSFDAVNGESLIQITIKGMQSSYFRTPKANFNKCLELLLMHPKIRTSINHRDKKYNTALHYAAKNGDQETALELLRNGACVGLLNIFNEPPLVGINAETLETYLDECITTNDKRPTVDDYEIHMRYSFLVHSNNSLESELCQVPQMDHDNNNDREDDPMPEADALLYMTRNEELRPLLKHPVITSFLYLKWHRISGLFYVNFAFYLFLCLWINIYIIFGYGVKKKQPGTIETLNIIAYFCVFIGLILLICRELFQLLVSPIRYLKSIENWLEILLIIVTAWIVGSNSAEESTKQQLSAGAILLSSAELVLFIGQFPTLSTNIAMLKTVSWNFFKFLLWYCILILAFAMSFYTLFRQDDEDQKVPNRSNCTKENEQQDFFKNPGRSLFKTIVMLTGEFEAGSINFSTFPATSHIIFILFVFMIPIVLFNLLNGLAVGDTQEIRADAELVGLMSRVNVISYFESVLIGNSKSYSRPSNCWSWLPSRFENLNIIKSQMFRIKRLAKRINVFPDFLPKYTLIMKPNQDNKIKILEPLGNTYEDRRSTDIESGGTYCCLIKRCQNNSFSKIIKNAKNVVSKRAKVAEFDKINDHLFQNEIKMESLAKTMKEVLHALELYHKELQQLKK